MKTAKILSSEKELDELLKTKPKGTRIIFRFLMSPTKLNGEDGKISSVEFCKNVLKVKFRIEIFLILLKREKLLVRLQRKIPVKEL